MIQNLSWKITHNTVPWNGCWSGNKCFAQYFLSTPRIHLSKTGACDVPIFGFEVICLLTINVFSSGNCLPLVLLIQQHVQQLQNPNPIYQQVTKQRSSVSLPADQASPQISNWQNFSVLQISSLGSIETAELMSDINSLASVPPVQQQHEQL